MRLSLWNVAGMGAFGLGSFGSGFRASGLSCGLYGAEWALLAPLHLLVNAEQLVHLAWAPKLCRINLSDQENRGLDFGETRTKSLSANTLLDPYPRTFHSLRSSISL